MTQHLKDMRIDKVSLVDKGANARRFAVLKQDDSEHVTDERTLVQKVIDAIDAKFAPVPDVDPFDTAIDTLADEDVAKAGRKISGTRLSAIKTAMTTLYDIVEEVEPGWWTPPGGNISKENPDMTDEQKQEQPDIAATVAAEVEKQVTAAFTSEAFTTAISKAVTDAMPKPELAELIEPAEDEVTLETVAEAVTELAKRMDSMGRGRRQSIDAQDGEPVKKSALAGILS